MNNEMNMKIPSQGIECAVECPPMKHAILMNEVNQMDTINDHLAALIGKVNGCNAEDMHSSVPIRDEYPLSEALAAAPIQLTDHREKSHQLIDVLEQLIF